MNELSKLQPVPILLVTYNRIGFLKQAIDAINTATLYPFYLMVVDNNSTDGSVGYLKSAKVRGKIWEHLFLSKNVGQSKALNELIKLVDFWRNRRRQMANWIIFANEDITPPHLRPKCWLEQMIEIFERNEKEDGLGALTMRIQRMSRAEIDMNQEIIYWQKGIPSTYRLMRWTDIVKLGDKPMGELKKWNSNTVADKLKFQLKKRYGFTTHIYANHLGWCENKGFKNGVNTLTVADNKIDEHLLKPYPDIDPETNVPIKINHPCDEAEMRLRNKYKHFPETITLTCKRNGKEEVIILNNDGVGSEGYCMMQDIEKVLSFWEAKR